MTADSSGVPWEGRNLKSNPFAGDDGTAEPALAAALEAFRADPTALIAVVDALSRARVLVPVLAELAAGGQGEHGQTIDKAANAGVVALEAEDGRRALPVFSSVAAMAAWRPDARPVPVEAARAALSAVAEDWSLLVLDPSGPVTALVPRPAVWALAQGRAWEPAVRAGVVAREVADEIERVVAPVAHVARIAAHPGRSAEIAVALAIDPGLDRAGLDAVLAQVNAALAGSSVISERVDSLELRIGRAH